MYAVNTSILQNINSIFHLHQLSVLAKGILSDELSEASLSLHADSPVSQEMHFLAHIIKKETEDASNLDFKVQ